MKRSILLGLMVIFLIGDKVQSEQPNPIATIKVESSEGGMAFSHNGGYLVVGERNAVKLYHTKSGKLVKQLGKHSEHVWYLSFSPDDKYIASSSPAGGRNEIGELKLWRTKDRKLINTIEKGENRTLTFAFSPNSKYLAVGSEYGRDRETVAKLNIYKIGWRGIKLIKTLQGTEKWRIQEVAFSPDSKHLVCSGSVVDIWRVRDWTFVGTLDIKPSMNVPSGIICQFSTDGKQLIILGNDSKIHFFQVPNLEFVKSIPGDNAISPDGKYIIGPSKTNSMWFAVYTVDGNLIGEMKDVVMVSFPLFSPDGQYMAYKGERNTIKIWDFAECLTCWRETGKPIIPVQKRTGKSTIEKAIEKAEKKGLLAPESPKSK